MMAAWAGRACGFTIVGLGVALVLVATFSETAGSTSFGVVLASIPWIGVGAFVVATRPRNPIGWLFSAVGLFWTTCYAASPDANLKHAELNKPRGSFSFFGSFVS